MTGATNAAMGGATPLSSSSLSNYYNADAAPASPPGLHTPYDTAGTGGIMNFIFRGGKQVRADSTRRGFHDPDNNNGPPSIVHLPQVPDAMRQSDVPPTERERVEMEVIKALIESYFGIVRKNFIDMVPKTIMYFLVNHVRDAMQNELVSELYRDAEIGTLMQEAEDIAQRRHTCMEMKDLLGKALEIVNEVRDYNTFK
jgi:dynamin 1-like protein